MIERHDAVFGTMNEEYWRPDAWCKVDIGKSIPGQGAPTVNDDTVDG